MPIIRSTTALGLRAPRLMIVAALTGALAGVPALAGDGHDLQAYVGDDVEVVLRDLGEPTLKTPTTLWYSSQPRVSGGMPGVPNPAVVGGRQGVMVRGAGGDYEPLMLDPDLCDVTVNLDKSAKVATIESAGPGCFEFLHQLKRARLASP